MTEREVTKILYRQHRRIWSAWYTHRFKSELAYWVEEQMWVALRRVRGNDRT